MGAYVSCPCGQALMAPDRGRTRILCKRCKRWVLVQNGVAIGYA